MKENISMVTENGSGGNTKRSSDSKPAMSEYFRKPRLAERPKAETKRLSKLFRALMKQEHTTQNIVAEKMGIAHPTLNRSIVSESMSMRRFLDILDVLDCEIAIKSKHNDENKQFLTPLGNDPCDGCKYKSYYENMMNAQAQFEAKMLEDARSEAREHVKNLLMK